MSTWEKIQQEGFAKGELEGEAKGELKGEVKGRVATLLKLLTLKFGALAPSVIERVQQASTEELELWTERILTAQTLEDVLR